jgi:hypothetical protein
VINNGVKTMTMQTIEVTDEVFDALEKNVSIEKQLTERINSLVDDFQALILEKLDIIAKLPVTAEMFDDENQDSVKKAVRSRLSEKASVANAQIDKLHKDILEHKSVILEDDFVSTVACDVDFIDAFKKFSDLVNRHNKQCRVAVDIFIRKLKVSNMSETEIAIALDNDELDCHSNAECSLEVFATVSENSNLVAYLKYATVDGQYAVTARMIRDFYNIADVDDVFCDLQYELDRLKDDYRDALRDNNFEEIEYIQSRIDSITI